jgi:cytochrome c-type biogenesis protein CcmH
MGPGMSPGTNIPAWPRRHAAVLGAAVAVLAVLAAVVTVVGVGHRPATMDRRVQDVATTLKCPSCNGESVAASNAPIAQSMRSEIRHQLGQGRSPDQIRSWFEGRYGSDVVTLPASGGPAMLLWVLPAVVLCGGAALAIGLVRRRARSTGTSAVATALPGKRVAVAAGACLAVGALVPAAVWARADDGRPAQAAAPSATTAPSSEKPLTADGWSQVGTSLESQHDYAGAARAYRHAVRLRPGSAPLRIRLGFDLLRAGRAHDAVPVVRRLSQHPGPERSMALLVLGLAQRTEHDPGASHTLRTFLKVAPHHPAAAQVRRLLAQDG